MNDKSKNYEQEFNQLLLKPDSELIKDIIEYNQISFLLLSGVFDSRFPKNYGFFLDVFHVNGNKIKYPNGQYIDDIFIHDPYELQKGERYYFECKLARKQDRVKKNNPYLLQTTIKEVQQGERIKSIEKVIEEKEFELKQIKDTTTYYEQNISEKITEISKKEGLILKLHQKIELTHFELNKITQEKSKMENIIEILKARISICRNLEFLTEQEEKLYLSALTYNNITLENHLSFQDEFESNFAKLADHIHQYLFHQKNLIYTRFQIRNFLTLLRTQDLIILSGLSGSGKTQIIKAFAEALGGVAKIIPVKPNWTSSDDLIGYYNPIQTSFLPTPFTEAIVEAIQNPHKLYFICLDEMNLARVEYYFADFLSKLEERNQQPEIELYAKHEEELFISEFKILLGLIESSTGNIPIKSWQDFLNNNEARQRFLEMLGKTDQESLLQLHAKMKRRLIDILKFPSTIKIPNNVRFIGAINVDETTHYFSPKILDRVHIVKFENPLLYEEKVRIFFENREYNRELKPVYVSPDIFSQRSEYPTMDDPEYSYIAINLKEINKQFLLPLNIDFGVRSIRQSLNYAKCNRNVYEPNQHFDKICLNTIITQKILPRFLFDSSEITKNGSTKLEILESLVSHLKTIFNDYYNYTSGDEEIGKVANNLISEMIQTSNNNRQINFFA